MGCLASVDFFVVPTATFRLLFVFIVLHHERRHIVHFGVTAHPTPLWASQQIREAFPWETWTRVYSAARSCFRGMTRARPASTTARESQIQTEWRSSKMNMPPATPKIVTR